MILLAAVAGLGAIVLAGLGGLAVLGLVMMPALTSAACPPTGAVAPPPTCRRPRLTPSTRCGATTCERHRTTGSRGPCWPPSNRENGNDPGLSALSGEPVGSRNPDQPATTTSKLDSLEKAAAHLKAMAASV